MKFDPPLLYRGGLSRHLYVATHGKTLDGDLVEASVKYDVTAQFPPLVASIEITEGMVNAALIRFYGITRLADIDEVDASLDEQQEAMHDAIRVALSLVPSGEQDAP